MLNDSRVNKYLFFAPAPIEMFESYFGPIIKNIGDSIEDGLWSNSATFILRDDNMQFMGMAALVQNSFISGNFDIGYQLPVHAWRRGIASAVSLSLTRLAFEELDAHKIIGECYASNEGSIKVLLKSGYTQEGRLKNYYFLGESKDDKLIFGITKREYDELKIYHFE